MPNELSINLSLSFDKGNLLAESPVNPFRATVAGSKYIKTVQNVGFSTAEPLLKGDITAIGYLFVRNLDATNFVTLQAGSAGTPIARLKAGESMVLRLDPASDPHFIANTAAVNVEILLIED